MRNFELIFHVPAHHALVPVRWRSRGGEAPGDYWDHVEIDESGRVVARYSSFKEDGPGGRQRSGYRKLTPDGVVLADAPELPPDPEERG